MKSTELMPSVVSEPEPAPELMERARKLAEVLHGGDTARQRNEDMVNALMSPVMVPLLRMSDEYVMKAVQPDLDHARKGLREGLDTEGVIKAYAAGYARAFSEGELDALIAFYAGPLGRKLIEQTVAVEKQASAAQTAKVNRLQYVLQRTMAASMEGMFERALQIQRTESGLTVGLVFPQFSGACLDGGQFDINSLKGKVVYITAWSFSDQAGLDNVARAKELHARLFGRGFSVVGLNQDYADNVAAMNAYLATNPQPWPNVVCGWGPEGLDLSHKLVLDQKHRSYLVGRDGRLLAIDPNLDELPALVEKALDAVVQ